MDLDPEMWDAGSMQDASTRSTQAYPKSWKSGRGLLRPTGDGSNVLIGVPRDQPMSSQLWGDAGGG
eukprot:1160368-Pelagomonas_calceolata.AAC.5